MPNKYNRRRHGNHQRHSNHYQSHDDIEIPGFYFDPDKKRYFRIPAIISNLFKTKQKKELNVLKVKGNYLNLFSHRQLSLVSSGSFVDRLLRLKLSRMKHVYSFGLSERETDYPVVDCKYLIGSPENATFVAACTLKKGGGVSIQSFSLKSKNEDCDLYVNYEDSCGIHFRDKISDLCVADIAPDQNYVLYTSVDFSPRSKGSTMVFRGMPHLNSHPGMCGVYEYEMSWEMKTLLCSCAWNRQTQTFAVGGERFLCTKDLNGEKHDIPCKDKCFSLAYNSFGNQLFVGSNTGNLCCFDQRCNKFVSSYKLGRGISYIKLLRDENFIIASAYEDKIMQVDLRTGKPILDYPDHVNEYLKLPFSIDDEANVLCSAGQDKIIRLWSLKEGKLLHAVQPDSKKSASNDQPMAWYSASWQISSQQSASCLVLIKENNVLLYK